MLQCKSLLLAISGRQRGLPVTTAITPKADIKSEKTDIGECKLAFGVKQRHPAQCCSKKFFGGVYDKCIARTVAELRNGRKVTRPTP